MYNLSYEQLKRRTIISLVISVLLFIVMFVINISSGGIEIGFLIATPIVLIIWTLEVLGTLVCWRELWKPWLLCVLDACKSLICLGAGAPVIGFFTGFIKSLGILVVSVFKALFIAIKVIVYVIKGKEQCEPN